MNAYKSPRRPDLRAIRVMICESEIRAFQQKFPLLSREEIFAEMSRAGPDRAKVELAIEALANRPAAKLIQRIRAEARLPASYRQDREAEWTPHPSESVLRKI